MRTRRFYSTAAPSCRTRPGIHLSLPRPGKKLDPDRAQGDGEGASAFPTLFVLAAQHLSQLSRAMDHPDDIDAVRPYPIKDQIPVDDDAA